LQFVLTRRKKLEILLTAEVYFVQRKIQLYPLVKHDNNILWPRDFVLFRGTCISLWRPTQWFCPLG